MAIQTYNLGIVTAYGDAKAGGYTGTLAEWQELMASYATVGQQAAQSASDAQASAELAQQRADSITNLTVTAQTLPKTEPATAEYEDGVLTLGIPRGDGDKGDKGDKGDVGPAPTVTITQIPGGHRLTITDDTGDHSCDIMNGDGVVSDVLVNGSSVLSSGIANIPVASPNAYGVVKRQTTEQQDRSINTAIFGNSIYILKNIGSELSATSISATEVQIADGMLVAEGFVMEIAEGTTESLAIDAGTSGMLRTDLIVARYTKDSSTGAETMNLVVIKGTPASSDPVTPTYNTGSILAGDSPVDFPIYQVNIDGTTISTITSLVNTTNSLSSIENRMGGNYLPAGTNIDNLTKEYSGWWVYSRPDVTGTFILNDSYGILGHVQGTSNNVAMQFLRSNSQAASNRTFFVRYKLAGTWGDWQNITNSTLTPMTINLTQNNYCNYNDVTSMYAYRKGGWLWLRGNLHVTYNVPVGTTAQIGTVTGWVAPVSVFQNVIERTNKAVLLVTVSYDGKLSITNNSVAASAGYYNFNLIAASSDGQ